MLIRLGFGILVLSLAAPSFARKEKPIGCPKELTLENTFRAPFRSVLDSAARFELAAKGSRRRIQEGWNSYSIVPLGTPLVVEVKQDEEGINGGHWEVLRGTLQRVTSHHLFIQVGKKIRRIYSARVVGGVQQLAVLPIPQSGVVEAFEDYYSSQLRFAELAQNGNLIESEVQLMQTIPLGSLVVVDMLQEGAPVTECAQGRLVRFNYSQDVMEIETKDGLVRTSPLFGVGGLSSFAILP